jgi:hypothetical protein
MGLKRRNPARTRLLTTPVVPLVAAPSVANDKPAVQIENEVTKTEAPVATATPAPQAQRVSNEERHRMIAKVAYGFAERANFANDPVVNWLAAEREVDALLSRMAS